MIAPLLQTARASVKHRVWIISDLQQSDPANARACMTTAAADFRELQLPCDQIWYLGDAVEGGNLEHIEEMCRMQLEILASLLTPVRYTVGNHDFDYAMHKAAGKSVDVPFWRTVSDQPGWLTTPSIDSFHFTDQLGDYLVIFFSDHADPAGRWFCTHGKIQGDATLYPHAKDDYAAVRRLMETDGRKVITAGHYAFAGGNRPSDALSQLLPLPPSVKLHFYGHAHIGDARWAGKDLYRKISGTDHSNVTQIDVASLENRRGNAIRSAFLEIYRDGAMGVLFRDHQQRKWTELLAIED